MRVACIAMALVCYQRAGQKRWVVALAASLFAAGAFHYYGFFVLVPFLAAEFLHAIQTRAVRWGVWLAIFSGFLPLVAAYPILRQIKEFYGVHFWGQPTWAVVWNMVSALIRIEPLWLCHARAGHHVGDYDSYPGLATDRDTPAELSSRTNTLLPSS